MHNADMNQPALAAIDPDIADRVVSRRAAITKGASVSAAVATGLRVASVPMALAALSTDVYGQGRLPAVAIGVLNYALVLEELEYEFYRLGVAQAGLIPAADRAIFTTIRDHEDVHVDFLRAALGRSARPKPAFDFTGGRGSGTGPYADVFSNYETFKALAQAFEDTGVRAYKGQAPALMPYKDLLTAALTIHSVEGRHAAEVRRLRGNYTELEPFFQGWIHRDLTDVPGAAAVYAGEANTTHAGLDATTVTDVDDDEVTEAWDEPLTMAAVLSIISPFLA